MKISMNNKRSIISGEVIMFIPQMIFLIAVLFSFVFLVKILNVTNVDVRKIESDILVERMLFLRNGFLYNDTGIGDLGRLYPGIIDLKKFKEISLQTDKSYSPGQDVTSVLDNEVISYGSDNFLIAAKMNLTQEGKEHLVVYYNKIWFDRWEPKGVIPGPAGVIKNIRQRNVLVKEGDTLSFGILSFVVLS